MAPIENIRSIVSNGILSHDAAQDVPHFTIYDKGVLAHRLSKSIPGGGPLSSYANLFFQPSNSMLFSLLRKFNPDEIIVIGVSPSILKEPGVFVSDGNAATSGTVFFPSELRRHPLKRCQDALEASSWSPMEKSLRMAECLYPNRISRHHIKRLYVRSPESKKKVIEAISGLGFPEDNIVIEKKIFFESYRVIPFGGHLQVRDGDMFLSSMQTLTISVNCVGAMGRGQASTARFYFPELYEKYKQLCNDNQLKLGEPYLCKLTTGRGLSDSNLVSDDSVSFLLFPTKHHFKDTASLEGIRQGLVWFQQNYQKEGVESIAFPALGCGLGWLSWRDVWPVMRSHLLGEGIPIEVYLPSSPYIPNSEILS
jgi:O-acetyl-ADP-ribose deacetylase (regulator of RNase III)